MKAQRGSASLELVLLTPLFLALLLFVAAGGRLVTTNNEVLGAAQDAARAASLQDTPDAANQAATRAAHSTLDTRRVPCRSLDVTVDASALYPGGSVAVTVRCTVGLSDLALLRVPGARTVTAHATEPIDRYRATQ